MNRVEVRLVCGAVRAMIAPSLIAFATLASVCAAQGPALQITSPANGTVVNPSATMSVSVVSPSNTAFTAVAIIGEDSIGSSDAQSSAPATFSVMIPADIDCGPHSLTAVGATSSGQNAARSR